MSADTIDGSNRAKPSAQAGAVAPSQTTYQLPDRIYFLLHLRTVEDNLDEEMRLITTSPSMLTGLLTVRDAFSAEIHMLRPRIDGHDVPAFQRITETYRSESGVCIFRLETGEQYLSVDDQEPVRMVCLCSDPDDDA